MRKGLATLEVVLTTMLLIAGFLGWRANKITKEYQATLGGTLASTTDLTDTIGLFRTNLNGTILRLESKLQDTTSTDPGHVHTLSNGSGTLSIAKGGIGTSTSPLTNEILIGTSSSYKLISVPNCDTASSSKLLFSSTSQTFSCGTDFSIATSSATWSRVGETTLTVTNASTSVTIGSYKHLQVRINSSSTGAGQTFMRLNNSQAAIYGQRYSLNGAADTEDPGADSIFINGSGTATSSIRSVIDIFNSPNRRKSIIVDSLLEMGIAPPDRFQNYATFSTTTDITVIAIGITANSFSSSTVVSIYGSND